MEGQNLIIPSLSEFISESIPNVFVSLDVKARICQAFESHNLAKGEFLLSQGKIGGYYFLEEGYLRSFTDDFNGNEVTTSFYSSKRVIFDPSCCFLNQPSNENIQALTDCKGYFSSFDKLDELFHEIHEFREFARMMIVNEFISFKKDALHKINSSAEDNYLQLLETNRDIFQIAQLKQIASYLGITDTSLSRLRREFVKKGKV
jgi:CRP-like cAMP-binding protein